jgi:hypothetical protein
MVSKFAVVEVRGTKLYRSALPQKALKSVNNCAWTVGTKFLSSDLRKKKQEIAIIQLQDSGKRKDSLHLPLVNNSSLRIHKVTRPRTTPSHHALAPRPRTTLPITRDFFVSPVIQTSSLVPSSRPTLGATTKRAVGSDDSQPCSLLRTTQIRKHQKQNAKR